MEYKKWFEQAEEDFSTAKYNFEGKKYYACAFFCQQSVEKALKAIIMKESDCLIKIHDLFALGRKAGLPVDLLKKCSELSIAYTDSRYGMGNKIPAKNFSESECVEYQNIAKGVLEWAKKKI